MLPQGFLGTRGDILMDLVVLVWVPLVIVSFRKFANPPVSNAFGPTHRKWGRLGMLLMMASGLSAVPLYYLGFAV